MKVCSWMRPVTTNSRFWCQRQPTHRAVTMRPTLTRSGEVRKVRLEYLLCATHAADCSPTLYQVAPLKP